MKKMIMAIALVLPMVASAQKFGHVNTQELFTMMPEMATVRAQMDTLQSQYESTLSMMNEELQTKYKDYQANQATMTDAIRQMREQELNEIQQRIQTTYQIAEQDIQKKQQELLAPVHERMSLAIQKVGEKEGYTYIFDTATLVYIDPNAADLMPAVKKELGIK